MAYLKMLVLYHHTETESPLSKNVKLFSESYQLTMN